MTEQTEKEVVVVDEQKEKDDAFFAKKITELKEVVKGLSKEDLIKRIDDFRFYHAFSFIKENVKNVKIEGELEEVSEEKIINVLGHQNIHARVNDADGQFEVYLNLKKGVVIVRDTHEGVALLRALYFLYTSEWKTFEDAVPVFVKKWQQENNTNENPYIATEKTLEQIADAYGIDIDTLEEKVQQQMEAVYAKEQAELSTKH